MIRIASSFEERRIFQMIGRPKELSLKEKPTNFLLLIWVLQKISKGYVHQVKLHPGFIIIMPPFLG